MYIIVIIYEWLGFLGFFFFNFASVRCLICFEEALVANKMKSIHAFFFFFASFPTQVTELKVCLFSNIV